MRSRRRNSKNDIFFELDDDTASILKECMDEDGFDDINEFFLQILKQYIEKRDEFKD